MKTVLLAAACSLLLACAAHAVDAPPVPDTQPVGTQTLPTLGASGNACTDGAAVSRASYTTDDDAETDSGTCLQFLSTQTLVQPRPEGRT